MEKTSAELQCMKTETLPISCLNKISNCWCPILITFLKTKVLFAAP